MSAPASIHNSSERSFLRRQRRLAIDLNALARAPSQTITGLSQERGEAVRDLADVQIELREAAAPARGWATAERRTAAVENLRTHVRDLEARIAAIDVELPRLRKLEAAAQRDAQHQAQVFEALRKTVNRALEPQFFDEMWSSR